MAGREIVWKRGQNGRGERRAGLEEQEVRTKRQGGTKGRAGRGTGGNKTAGEDEGQGWKRNRGQQNGRGERRA
uniref:Uncharacterized protein n=1 Tax=Chromera velia CCMP2878 TaxID=1169474 RepID=A0A0G4GCK1_9ALVE|eukprot:Cvel_21295.t1-p1 / transcript=Cvel_21295.t1 / gene=Cvel_21295 / organism=Chromera_velia_CCMP2878 / gene_product=hypothetical protein / transcript_product=hypothetical protein / location=Cvel_scaffold1983:36156-36371(+) / protein_length=72 / sequence_SO=supercontig / SO=protein_coding / is_pseudo=false